jgi:hemerythrin-like domain-containing protein
METIFSMLASDHAVSEVLFSRACSFVRADDFGAARLALTSLAATLEHHLETEETHVFAAVDAALAPGKRSTAVLRAEHRQILGVLKRMADSVDEGDRYAFIKHAGTLRLVLQLHNEKEEKVFYPMAEKVLRAQRERIHAAIAGANGARAA